MKPSRALTPLLAALSGLSGLSGCVAPPAIDPLAHLPQDIYAMLPAETLASVRAGIEASMVDLPLGRPHQGRFTDPSEALHLYRFRAAPGMPLTITARSAGPDVMLVLYEDALYQQSNQIAIDLGSEDPRDPNGPHSELITLLPPDTDQHYVLEVRQTLKSGQFQPGDYTLFFTPGVSPAADILVNPALAPRAAFSSDGRKDRRASEALVRLGNYATEAAGGSGAAPVVGRALPIALGERREATPADYSGDLYEFVGTPGSPVTITLRSNDFPIRAALLADDSHDPASLIAFDQNQLKAYDSNGLNAEIIATLPADRDGRYYVWVAPEHQRRTDRYSITLTEGHRPAADIVRVPKAIFGNSGRFMSPYTEDGTVAPWVEKGLSASVARNLSRTAGALSGGAAGGNNAGLALAVLAGEAAGWVGSELALQAMGGWAAIKADSDLSFDSLEDMARYLQHHHAEHPDYQDVLAATYGIYPELRTAIFAAR